MKTLLNKRMDDTIMPQNIDRILNWVQKKLIYLPHIMFVISVIVLVGLIILNRFDLLYKSCVILLPLIVTSLVLIFNKNIWCNTPTIGKNLPSYRLIKLYLIVLSFLVMWLCLGQQDVIYLILISTLYCITLVSALTSISNPKWLLFEIIATTSLLILPQFLINGIYFGDTDLTVHANYATMIVNSGGTPEDIFGQYQFFCLFHIFSAVVSIISGITTGSSLCIISSVAILSSIPIVYLVAKYFTHSKYISVFSAYFYALLPMILDALQVPAPRILATMAFFIVIYLLFSAKNKHEVRYVILSILVITYMTGVHHAQLPLCVFVMMAICFGSILYFKKITIGNKLVLLLFFILPIMYLSYTYLSGLVSMVGNRFLTQIESGAVATTTIQETIAEFQLTFILNTLYAGVLTIFIFVGIYLILTKISSDKKIWTLFPLLLLLFVVFIPFVLDIFPSITNAFQIYRLRVVLTMFFAIAMGIGVTVLLNLSLNSKRKIFYLTLIILLCLLLIFSSVVICHSKSNDVFYYIDGLEPYKMSFDDAESEMLFSIQKIIPNGSTLYADHRDIRYFSSDMNVGKYGLNYYYYGYTLFSAFTEFNDTKVAGYMYILLPLERYTNEGVMLYESKTEFVESKFSDPSKDSENLQIFYSNIFLHDLMYNNGGNMIYYHP